MAWIAAGGLLPIGVVVAWLESREPTEFRTARPSLHSATARETGAANANAGPAALARQDAAASAAIDPDYANELRSWLLAACQRGLDCSRESPRYRLRCAFDPLCQPYETGMVDVIRRATAEGFADVERRATEINRMLDQDRFDELGL